MSDSNKGLTSADRVLKLMSLIPQSEPGITLKQLHKQLSDMGFDAKLRTLYRDLKKIKDTNQEYRLVSSSKGRTEASYHFEKKHRIANQSARTPQKKSDDQLFINRTLDFSNNVKSDSVKEKRVLGYRQIAFRIEFVSEIQSELEGEGSSYFSYYEIENYYDRRFIIFNAAPSDDLCNWIFSLGDRVVVHEPFFLRERIERCIARMLESYSSDFSGFEKKKPLVSSTSSFRRLRR